MYSIHGTGSDRVLVVQATSANRLRFYHKDGKEQVQFKPSGARIVAAVVGVVQVYKKPSANEFHREYMAHNARALWLGLQSDPDRLVDNMLEYVESI